MVNNFSALKQEKLVRYTMNVTIICMIVIIVLGIALGVFALKSKDVSSKYTEDLKKFQEENILAHTRLYEDHEKLGRETRAIYDELKTMDKAVNDSLAKSIQSLAADYEAKLSNLEQMKRTVVQDMMIYMKSIDEQARLLAPATIPGLRTRLAHLKTFEKQLEKVRLEIERYSKLFNGFKVSMIRTIESMPRMDEKLESISQRLHDLSTHIKQISDKLIELEPVMTRLEIFNQRISELEVKTAIVSAENNQMIESVVKDYQALLPVLQNLPQTHASRTDFTRIENEYETRIRVLQEDIESLSVQGRLKNSSEAMASLTDFKSRVASVRGEVDRYKAITNDLNNIKQIESQIGDINLAQHKDHIVNVPKIGAFLKQMGDVDLVPYAKDLPNVAKLPEVLEKLGDTSPASFSKQLKNIVEIPSLSTRLDSLQKQLSRTSAMKLVSNVDSSRKTLNDLGGAMAALDAVNMDVNQWQQAYSVSRGNLVARSKLCIADQCIDKAALRKLL